MIKFLQTLEKKIAVWFLLFVSFFFFLLRLPSLFEPYWYGDEGIYQVIGVAMRHGRLLYRDIWDNKPPLLYILYGIFSADQFTIRLFSLVVGIVTILTFFALAKVLFTSHLAFPEKNDNKPQPKHMAIVYIITFLFALLFGLPLIEGNIANAENFMMLPILLSALLLCKTKKLKNGVLFLAGILLSIAFLFKIVAVFDFTAFALFLFCISYTTFKNIVTQIVKLIPFVVGFFLPIILVGLFFLSQNAFSDFLSAAFTQNVGYVGYGNSFIIGQGLLFMKLLVLFLFAVVLFFKRRSFSKTTLFIFLWSAFSLFNAFFSQRPYTHYVLVLLPSILLLLGLLYSVYRIPNMTLRTNTKQLRIFCLIFFLCIVTTVATHFYFYKKNIAYYGNFIQFVSGQKNTTAYQAFFDRNTPKDYAIAQFIKRHSNGEKNVFLWGDSAQIYVLSGTLPPGRYTVAYHMTNNAKTLQETQTILEQKKPSLIILTPGKNYPFSLASYQYRYTLENRAIYERIH